jgi:hypothetical protein
VYRRRAKFSVWFSGAGPDRCLYNGEAVENCAPEKGEILRFVFRCGSFIGACTTGKLWRIGYLRMAKFSVWFSGVGPGWRLYKLWRIVYLRRAKFSVWFSGAGPLLVIVQRGSCGELCT